MKERLKRWAVRTGIRLVLLLGMAMLWTLRTALDYVWWNVRVAWDVENVWSAPYKPWWRRKGYEVRTRERPPSLRGGTYTFQVRSRERAAFDRGRGDGSNLE